MACGDPLRTLPQSSISILPSQAVTSADLYQCPHHGGVLGTGLGPTSPEIPVSALP